jgi:phage terminase small subunit
VKSHFPGAIAMPDHRPPTYLSKAAKLEWLRIIALLKDRGLFDETRLCSIEAYCANFARFRETDQKLAVEKDSSAIDMLLSLTNTAQRKLREHGRDLGLAIQVQPRAKGRKEIEEIDWSTLNDQLTTGLDKLQ